MVLSITKMLHVKSDIVLSLFTVWGCRMLGNVWNATCYGQFCVTDGPYTHSSEIWNMAGTSVIPGFLAHWHTSISMAKLCFRTWVPPMYYLISV